MSLVSGPYSAREREAVAKAAESVRAGRVAFQDAVTAVSNELRRSERGVSLLLGRTVRRLDGRSSMSRAGVPPKVQHLVRTIKDLSRRRKQLVARREAIDAQIVAVDRRLARLTPTLLALAGLPDHVGQADVADVEQRIEPPFA